MGFGLAGAGLVAAQLPSAELVLAAWLANCIGLAWVATTVGEYGQALLAIGLFSLIQLRGLRAGSASQELLSLAKAVAFLALVAACFLPPMAIAGWRCWCFIC